MATSNPRGWRALLDSAYVQDDARARVSSESGGPLLAGGGVDALKAGVAAVTEAGVYRKSGVLGAQDAIADATGAAVDQMLGQMPQPTLTPEHLHQLASDLQTLGAAIKGRQVATELRDATDTAIGSDAERSLVMLGRISDVRGMAQDSALLQQHLEALGPATAGLGELRGPDRQAMNNFADSLTAAATASAHLDGTARLSASDAQAVQDQLRDAAASLPVGWGPKAEGLSGALTAMADAMQRGDGAAGEAALSQVLEKSDALALQTAREVQHAAREASADVYGEAASPAIQEALTRVGEQLGGAQIAEDKAGFGEALQAMSNYAALEKELAGLDPAVLSELQATAMNSEQLSGLAAQITAATSHGLEDEGGFKPFEDPEPASEQGAAAAADTEAGNEAEAEAEMEMEMGSD